MQFATEMRMKKSKMRIDEIWVRIKLYDVLRRLALDFSSVSLMQSLVFMCDHELGHLRILALAVHFRSFS